MRDSGTTVGDALTMHPSWMPMAGLFTRELPDVRGADASEETYLRWHQPMHSSHHDSDSMRLIRLWATREETKLSSRPPKLLLRMNHKLWATREETKLSSRPPKLLLRIHNYSWRHLLHNRWHLLLRSSVLRVGVDVYYRRHDGQSSSRGTRYDIGRRDRFPHSSTSAVLMIPRASGYTAVMTPKDHSIR